MTNYARIQRIIKHLGPVPRSILAEQKTHMPRHFSSLVKTRRMQHVQCNASGDTNVAALPAQIKARVLTPKELGVCVTHISSDREITTDFAHQASKSFTMASTYKIPIAIYCLSLVENGQLKLAQEHIVKTGEIRSEWPLRPKETVLKAGDTATIADLLRLMFQYSDNTASDIILQKVGGPEKVTSYLTEKLKIKDIQVTRTVAEAFAAKRIADGKSDQGTPQAMNHLLALVFTGNVFATSDAKDYLFKIMSSCKTAERMLDAALLQQCEVGCKTGSVPGLLTHNISVLKSERGMLLVSIFNEHPIELWETMSSPAREQVMKNDATIIRSLTRHFVEKNLVVADSPRPKI